MEFILQGTTPMLRVTVWQLGKEELFDLSDIDVAELTVSQRGIGQIVYTTAPTIDRENSRIIYIFSEDETMAIDPQRLVKWQIRLGKTDLTMPDGMLIVGTREGEIMPLELLSTRRIS